VGDVDGRRADPVVQIAQLVAHQAAEFGVERAKRFVHHERKRPADDGASESHALAIAAREARHRAIEQFGDPQNASGFLDPCLNLGALHAHRDQRKGDISPHIHVRIEREELEHESDVASRGALLGNVLACQQNATRGRQFQPRDHAQGGRLAAAGRTEQAEELAILDGKVRVLDRDEMIKYVQSCQTEEGTPSLNTSASY